MSLVNILATGLIVMAVYSGGERFAPALDVLGDVTMLVLALAGLGALIYLVIFLLRPRQKVSVFATSSAQYSAQLGGTRTARMGA
jgi:hypothetical protein